MLIKKELPKPNLDDRTFAQLVDEALKLVPGLAPEWTDHNLSDPGITLTDLFAWLAETSLYRVNLINDRHRLKYLKLLNAYPLPAKPAEVELTFESDKALQLTGGTEVVTTVAGTEISFELKEDLTVAPVSLVKIVVDELTGGVHDRTKMNGQADRFFAAFGFDIQKECALYLGFDKPSDTITFMCYLHEKDLIPCGSHGRETEYGFDNSVLQWEILLSGNIWKQIKPQKDGTAGFKKSGRLEFAGLQDWLPSKIFISGDACCWLRCVVDASAFEYPPEIENIRLNTVSAVQGRTITIKEEWTGNGLPHQKYSLKNKPVIIDSLAVSVDGVYAKERTDFDGSGPQDNHFVLKDKEGEIIFGDNIWGEAPPAGSKIKVERYRTCNGAEGNISGGYLWKIKGIDDTKIINHYPASGGTGRETVDEAVAGFIKEFCVPCTAVTTSDFEYLSVNTPGLRVAKAKALPNYHPEKGALKGSVTVIVIPFTPLEFFKAPPIPSAGFRQAICRHLDEHRLLGTSVHVEGPEYVKVTVSAEISVSGSYQETDIKDAAIKALNRFLHPVRGGKEHKGWPVGRNVYRSEIYEEIEKIEGARCITGLHISGDKGTSDKEGNLILPSPLHTVYSGSHSVSVTSRQDACIKKRPYER